MKEKKFTTKTKMYETAYRTRQDEVILHKDLFDFENINDQYFEDEDTIAFVKGRPNTVFKPKTQKANLTAELIVSNICKLLDIDVVDVIPAVRIVGKNYESVDGVIVKNYIDDKEKEKVVLFNEFVDGLMHYVDKDVNYVCEFASKLERKHNIKHTISKSFKNDLIKQLVVSFLTADSDRHSGNYGIKITDKNHEKVISLVKAFDFDLGFMYPLTRNSNLVYEKYTKSQKKELIDFYKKEFDPYFYLTKHIEEGQNKRDLSKYEILLNQIAETVVGNKELKEFFNNIKNMSFEDVLINIKRDAPAYEINKAELKVAEIIFNSRRQELIKKVEKLEKSENFVDFEQEFEHMF